MIIIDELPVRKPEGSLAQLDGLNPINRNLVGWWLLGEGRGRRVFDVSRQIQPAALTNFAATEHPWRPAQNGGQALEFTGGSRYVNLGSIQRISNPAAMSFSGWVYINAFGANGGILSNRTGTGWVNLWSSTGVLQIYNGAGFQSSGHTLPLKQWVHIAWVKNGSSWTFYKNGVSDAGSSFPITQAGIGNVSIGAWDGGTSSPNANFCNFRVWDRALNRDEIRILARDDPFAGLIKDYTPVFKPVPGQMTFALNETPDGLAAALKVKARLSVARVEGLDVAAAVFRALTRFAIGRNEAPDATAINLHVTSGRALLIAAAEQKDATAIGLDLGAVPPNALSIALAERNDASAITLILGAVPPVTLSIAASEARDDLALALRATGTSVLVPGAIASPNLTVTFPGASGAGKVTILRPGGGS